MLCSQTTSTPNHAHPQTRSIMKAHTHIRLLTHTVLHGRPCRGTGGKCCMPFGPDILHHLFSELLQVAAINPPADHAIPLHYTTTQLLEKLKLFEARRDALRKSRASATITRAKHPVVTATARSLLEHEMIARTRADRGAINMPRTRPSTLTRALECTRKYAPISQMHHVSNSH